MKLISLQFALFSSEPIKRPDLVNEEINTKLGKIFDSMPTILNLPDNAPIDIPLVQAKSSDGKFSMNISRGRIDFIVAADFILSQEPYDVFKEQKITIEKFCKAVIGLMNIYRIGVIITLFEENNENVRAIFDKYLKVPYTARSSEIMIRMNNLQQIKGFVLNCIKTVEANGIHLEKDGEKQDQKGVLVLLDINNVPETDKLLTSDNLNAIITTATNYIKPNGLKEMI